MGCVFEWGSPLKDKIFVKAVLILGAWIALLLSQTAVTSSVKNSKPLPLSPCQENLMLLKAENTQESFGGAPRPLQLIGPPIDPQLVWQDLGRSQVLFELSPEHPGRGFKIFWARGSEIPHALKEIGRLREITFRQVGEGSGQAYDNDHFDLHYMHLVAWDKAKGQIAGAYRLGLVKDILEQEGTQGLYSAQLFDYESLLTPDFVHGAIEFGRSFVLAEYQRRSVALFALWRGIGSLLVQSPHYKYLMGPVSISGTFKDQSIASMLEFFSLHFSHPLAHEVRAAQPFHPSRPLSTQVRGRLAAAQGDFKVLDQLLGKLEGVEGRHSPPLLKIYADIGARMLGQNLDQEFNSVDIMILVPLAEQGHQVLKGYLGDQGAQSYLDYHQRQGPGN